jgi:hypothetical protein
MIRLVRQYVPRVDPYNDSGEIRTEVNDEYSRLMNSDEGPYNFLYNVISFMEMTHNRDIQCLGYHSKHTSSSRV